LQRFAKTKVLVTLLASCALCASLPLRAQAELEVVSLKSAIDDYSEFINAGLRSMFFRIGVYEPERVAAAREGEGPQLPGNHSPLFAPVGKPTIETAVEAMTLAVLSVFDQHAGGK
jgi:hypothetical protein